MKNMNSLDRMRLLMGYDPSKTLNENTEELNLDMMEDIDFSETDIDEAGRAVRVGKEIQKAKTAVYDVAKVEASLAKSLGMDLKKVKEFRAKSIQEIEKDLAAAVKKDFNSGVKIGQQNVTGQSVREIVNGATAHEVLQYNRTLTRNEIEAIVRRNEQKAFNEIRAYESKMGSTVSKEVSAASKEVSAASKEVSAASKEVGAAGKEVGAAGKEVGAAGKESGFIATQELKSLEKEAQQGAKEVKSAQEAEKAVIEGERIASERGSRLGARLRLARMRMKKYGPKFYERLSAVRKKLNWKKLVLYGFAVYGAYDLYQRIFGDSPKDEDTTIFPPCVTNLNDYTVDVDSDGNPIIKAPSNEYGGGGLVFHEDGTVNSYDNSKTGTYSCASDTEVGDVSEQPEETMDRRVGINPDDESNEPQSEANDFSGIVFNWNSGDTDNEGDEGTIVPPPTPDVYTNCYEFPLTFGCKGDKVAEIQRCVCVNDDGKFGPITFGAIEAWAQKQQDGMSSDEPDGSMVVFLNGIKENGITEENYNSILSKCLDCNGDTEKEEDDTEKKIEDGGNDMEVPADMELIKLEPKKIELVKVSGDVEQAPPVILVPQEIKDKSEALRLYNGFIDDGSMKSRNRGNTYVYKGRDLTPEERVMLVNLLGSYGFRESKFNNDYRRGDKFVFKKNK